MHAKVKGWIFHCSILLILLSALAGGGCTGTVTADAAIARKATESKPAEPPITVTNEGVGGIHKRPE